MRAGTSKLFTQSKLPRHLSHTAQAPKLTCEAGRMPYCLKQLLETAALPCAVGIQAHSFPNGSTSVPTKQCDNISRALCFQALHETLKALPVVPHPSGVGRFCSARVASRPCRTRAIFHERGPILGCRASGSAVSHLSLASAPPQRRCVAPGGQKVGVAAGIMPSTPNSRRAICQILGRA